MRSTALALLSSLALSQPAWACANAMKEGGGFNAHQARVIAACLAGVALVTALFLYSRHKTLKAAKAAKAERFKNLDGE